MGSPAHDLITIYYPSYAKSDEEFIDLAKHFYAKGCRGEKLVGNRFGFNSLLIELEQIRIFYKQAMDSEDITKYRITHQYFISTMESYKRVVFLESGKYPSQYASTQKLYHALEEACQVFADAIQWKESTE